MCIGAEMARTQRDKYTAIRVGNVSRTVFNLPLWIAQRKGFMEGEGLRVTSEILDSAERIGEGLRSGALQVGMGPPESTIVHAYNGGPIRIVGGNARRLPHFIIAQPHIDTLEKLRGAKIGVLSAHEGTTYIVQEIARQIGLGPGEYELAVVGGAPTRWKLLQNQQIDAGLQPFPLSYEAEDRGFSNLGAAADHVPDWQFSTINVDMGWAEEHRETVIAFLRGLRRGRAYMGANPGEAAEIAANELGTSVELARRALRDTLRLEILDPDLMVSGRGMEAVFATLQAAGIVPAEHSFDLSTMADLSFLQRA